MTYRLVIDIEATKVVAAMDETAHGLFVMACLDLPRDPHGLGRVMRSTGGFTVRSYALGSLGLIVYGVDDSTEVVTVLGIIWTG